MTLLVTCSTPDLLAMCEEVRGQAVFGYLPDWASKALESGTRQDRVRAITVAKIMRSTSFYELSKFMQGAVEAGDTRFLAKAEEMLEKIETQAKIRHQRELEESRIRERERYRNSPEGQAEKAARLAKQERKRRERANAERERRGKTKGNNPSPQKFSSSKHR